MMEPSEIACAIVFYGILVVAAQMCPTFSRVSWVLGFVGALGFALAL